MLTLGKVELGCFACLPHEGGRQSATIPEMFRCQIGPKEADEGKIAGIRTASRIKCIGLKAKCYAASGPAGHSERHI